MPLTEENFRPDNRKGMFLRALSSFYLDGRAPAEPGEVFYAHTGLAQVLLHSNKAERCEGPARPAPKQPVPAEAASDALTHDAGKTDALRFKPGETSAHVPTAAPKAAAKSKE